MMRTCRTMGLVVAVALAGVSAERPTITSADQAEQVRGARMAQNAAIVAREMEQVAACWTEDVTVTAGSGRVVRGRSEYRRALEADPTAVYERMPERIEVSSNENWPLAFETGTWTATPADGGATFIRGRYATLWVKAGGRWLIRSEVFVSLECSVPACERPVHPL